jgi:hypothetical protein
MTESISVFVNGTVLNLPQGTDVAAAVRRLDPALERQIAEGSAYVTDGRGIEISSDARLAGGAILRVVVRSRRDANVDADA